MDYATISHLYQTRHHDIMKEVLRAILGISGTSQDRISLGLTRLKGEDRPGRSPEGGEYALLVRIPGPVLGESDREVVVDDSHIPVIVKGG